MIYIYVFLYLYIYMKYKCKYFSLQVYFTKHVPALYVVDSPPQKSEPCIQRQGFLGPLCLEYYPSSSFVLSTYHPGWGGRNLITPCIAPLPSDVFVSSFLQGHLEESQESQLRLLKLRTSCALKNFCLKTKFTLGLFLLHLRFYII